MALNFETKLKRKIFILKTMVFETNKLIIIIVYIALSSIFIFILPMFNIILVVLTTLKNIM